MPRVKRGTTHNKRRKNILKSAKGYSLGRKKLIKQAKTAITKAGANAYKDRRIKKRTARQLWNIKINAIARENKTTYSALINKLKTNKVILDRKILADLAENHKEVVKAIISEL